MDEHKDAIGGTVMMLAGMLIQWVHGFDEVMLLVAHAAGAAGAVFGAVIIIKKYLKDRKDNP